MQLTLISVAPDHRGGSPIVAVTGGDDRPEAPRPEAPLPDAINRAYALLVEQRTGPTGVDLQADEQFEVWQGLAPSSTAARLGTLTILPDADCFEYRAAAPPGR